MTGEPPAPAAKAGRRIVGGAWGTGFGLVVRLGARLAFLFVAGRLYGADLFGAFAIAVSVVEALVTVAGLSVKKTLFVVLDSQAPSRPAPHIVLDAAMLVLAAGVVLAGATVAAVRLAPLGLTGGALQALVLLAPMIAGQALLDLFYAATRWCGVVRHEVIGRSLLEPYGSAAIAAAAWAAGWREHGLVVAYAGGTLLSLGYALVAVRRRLGPWDLAAYRPARRTLAELAARARSNTANDVLNAVYGRLDIYLVGLFLGQHAAGLYNVARQIRAPLRQIRQSFDGLLIPTTASTLRARGAAATGPALASATRLLLTLQFPLLVLLAAFGAPLLGLFGASGDAVDLTLVILAAAEAIHAALGVGDLVFVFERPRLGLAVAAASMTVGGLMGFALIPALGLVGAALSVTASFAVQAALRYAVLRFGLGARPADASILPPLVAGLAALAACLAVRAFAPADDWPWRFAALAAGAAVLAAGLGPWLRADPARLQLAGFVSRHD